MSYARLTCLYRIAQVCMLAAILFAPGELLRVMMAVLLVAGELFHRAYAAIEATRVRQAQHDARDATLDQILALASSEQPPQTQARASRDQD